MEISACLRPLVWLTPLLAFALASCAPATRANMSSVLARHTFSVNEGVNLPRGRGGHAAGNVDGCVVVAGGNDWGRDRTKKSWLSDSVVYRDGQWVPGPSLPKPIADGMFAHDACGFYLAGGEDGSTKHREAYALTSLTGGGRWKTLAPLPAATSAGAGALAGNRFYAACGETAEGMSNQMWSLDVSKPGATWHSCRAVPAVARAFPALVACGPHLYLLGGLSRWSPLTCLRDAYEYDPTADRWRRLADLPWPGYAWAASPFDAAHILLAGQADGRIHADIWLVRVPDMTARKIGDAVIQTTTAPLIRVASEEWWLLGGEPDSNCTRTARVTVVHAD
jgi:N-acetylneuraminic acid mutarotase